MAEEEAGQHKGSESEVRINPVGAAAIIAGKMQRQQEQDVGMAGIS